MKYSYLQGMITVFYFLDRLMSLYISIFLRRISGCLSDLFVFFVLIFTIEILMQYDTTTMTFSLLPFLFQIFFVCFTFYMHYVEYILFTSVFFLNQVPARQMAKRHSITVIIATRTLLERFELNAHNVLILTYAQNAFQLGLR